MMPGTFSGSYDPRDCIFLLKPIPLPMARPLDPETRERLIQSGNAHYSDTIPMEHAPAPAYMELFDHMKATYKKRMAAEIRRLALEVTARRQGPITLVSLARAGTPAGVLLQRALRRFHNADAVHYSISIIRDRGIDQNALRYIMEQAGRPSAGIVFVDGWTAKGTITRELKKAVAHWNTGNPQHPVSDQLFVIADSGGWADVCATRDDYVIPSGLLNAIVSGLVSRSALVGVQAGDFHSCVIYDHLQEQDQSRAFVDEIDREMELATPAPSVSSDARACRKAVEHFLNDVGNRYGISDSNRIKPGIAEATRALLRRVPDILLLRDPKCPDVRHARLVAEQKGVDIHLEPEMPFRAATLIRDITRNREG